MKKVILANIGDLKFERWLRRRNAGEIAWRTKDAKVISIKDMTDEHLANTIAMLERKEIEESAYYDGLGACEN